jgi:hypothetical protein
VEKIIFNNAWILPDGKSQFDFVPEEIKSQMRKMAVESGTGAILSIQALSKVCWLLRPMMNNSRD